MEETTEFSFILKPSENGVGVFAVHDIKKGVYLRLFGNPEIQSHEYRILPTNTIPESFRMYCIERKDSVIAPPDFGVMPIGWYLNHSSEANAVNRPGTDAHKKYFWYAKRDISTDEEICINYNDLEEPESLKADYYK